MPNACKHGRRRGKSRAQVRLLLCEILLLNSSPGYFLAGMVAAASRTPSPSNPNSRSTTDIGMLMRGGTLSARVDARISRTTPSPVSILLIQGERPGCPASACPAPRNPHIHSGLAKFSHPLQHEQTDPLLPLLPRAHGPYFLPEPRRRMGKKKGKSGRLSRAIAKAAPCELWRSHRDEEGRRRILRHSHQKW